MPLRGPGGGDRRVHVVGASQPDLGLDLAGRRVAVGIDARRVAGPPRFSDQVALAGEACHRPGQSR